MTVGALLASGHLERRQRRSHARPADKAPSRIQAWAQRVLHEPRFWLAVIIGAVVGIPGGEYLVALHEVKIGKAPTVVQAADVVALVVIEFALVIVPLAFLMARPEGVKGAVERFKVWRAGLPSNRRPSGPARLHAMVAVCAGCPVAATAGATVPAARKAVTKPVTGKKAAARKA